jgi:hypothetical protein
MPLTEGEITDVELAVAIMETRIMIGTAVMEAGTIEIEETEMMIVEAATPMRETGGIVLPMKYLHGLEMKVPSDVAAWTNYTALTAVKALKVMFAPMKKSVMM